MKIIEAKNIRKKKLKPLRKLTLILYKFYFDLRKLYSEIFSKYIGRIGKVETIKMIRLTG